MLSQIVCVCKNMTKTKNKKKDKKKPKTKTEEEPERSLPEREKLTNYDIANRTCNLECLKHEKEPDWFTGLVKVVLIKTSRCEYIRRIWWAGLIALAYIMMGSVSTMVFYFCLAMKLPTSENVHVFLCTAGFQLLIPSGILMISELNGPSAPMKPICRRLNHFLLQISGLGCGLAGAFVILFFGKKDNVKDMITAHFFSGIFACFLTVLCAVFGPFLIFLFEPNCCSDYFGPLHLTLGATGFLTSSVCFITGIMRPSFTKWLPLQEIQYFMISFCVIYTFIVFLTPIIRCLSRKTEN